MLEDELLKLRFKRGDTDVLADIYDKYADYLLTIAVGLLNDHALAEDVVHDVFVSFAKSVTRFRIRGSLKAYLAKSAINKSRDHFRKRMRRPDTVAIPETLQCPADGPDGRIIFKEQSALASNALAQLPQDQREVVVMKVTAGFKFKQIAALQEISINAAQARYRYGIDKLRLILNSEMDK